MTHTGGKWLVALVVLALVLTGWTVAPAQQPQPRRGGILRIAHIGEPPTLDWHWSSGAIVSHILNNIYEAPVAMDSKFQPHPMLAEKIEQSGDRLTYTFALRKGVKFHNGKEMTSDDRPRVPRAMGARELPRSHRVRERHVRRESRSVCRRAEVEGALRVVAPRYRVISVAGGRLPA